MSSLKNDGIKYLYSADDDKLRVTCFKRNNLFRFKKYKNTSSLEFTYYCPFSCMTHASVYYTSKNTLS